MARTLVIVCESAAIVTDFGDGLLELDELTRTRRWGVRTAQRPVLSLENRIERVLREDVFDVGDEQFLVLLFMMHAENKQWLDLIEQLVVRIGEQIADVRIN